MRLNEYLYNMKTKEFNDFTNQILENITKKYITEQFDNEGLTQNDTVQSDTEDEQRGEEITVDTIKNLLPLSGLVNKISNIQDIGGPNGFGVLISVDNVTDEELTNSCGGTTAEEAEKNLMQSLHNDLEDKGVGTNFDITYTADGENNIHNIKIKIISNNEEILGSEMKENKEIKEKKEVILGSKKVCDECNKPMNECDCDKPEVKTKKVVRIPESKLVETIERIIESSTKVEKQTPKVKKTIKITESQMKHVLSVITEEDVNQPYTKTIGKSASQEGIKQSSVPGINITNRVHNENGKENSDNIKDVTKKIKDYTTFDGNDNPEFPKQIGKGEKVARVNTKDEDETVEDNRGRGPEDLSYDQEPSEQFTKRVKNSLEGDSTTGNSQDAAGVIKTDTGKNLGKEVERRKDIKSKEPLYPKEAVPVKDAKKDEENRVVNENMLNEKFIAEVKRMKLMSKYNQKTQ